MLARILSRSASVLYLKKKTSRHIHQVYTRYTYISYQVRDIVVSTYLYLLRTHALPSCREAGRLSRVSSRCAATLRVSAPPPWFSCAQIQARRSRFSRVASPGCMGENKTEKNDMLPARSTCRRTLLSSQGWCLFTQSRTRRL